MATFLAVQCFRCQQLQVAQQRRDKRFDCKLCGARQSVRKVFARSDRAAQLRRVVMQFNLERGIAAERYDDEKRIAQLFHGDHDYDDHDHDDQDGHDDYDGEHDGEHDAHARSEQRLEEAGTEAQIGEADVSARCRLHMHFQQSSRLQPRSRWHALETALSGARESNAKRQAEERSDHDDDGNNDDEQRHIVTTLDNASAGAHRRRGRKRARKRTSGDDEDGAPRRQRYCTALRGDEELQEQVWR